MTKTKAQLRAEAVERLKQLGEHNDGEDIVKAMVPEGVTVNRTNWTVELDTIIDLFTDDCSSCYACAKLAELRAENSQLRVKVDDLVNGNDGETNVITSGSPIVDELPKGDAPSEFAEILMALAADCSCMGDGIVRHFEPKDVQGDVDALMRVVERDYVRRAVYDSLKELTTDSDKWLKNKLEEARAERDELKAEVDAYRGEYEGMEFIVSIDEAMKFTTDPPGYVKKALAELREDVAERDDVIAVLKAENAELTAQLETAHAKNRSLKAHIAKMQEGRHGWHVKGVELQREVDRLTRENIALAHDLGECMAERDELKRENAKLSDDEFYLRCTLVDMDGEVVG